MFLTAVVEQYLFLPTSELKQKGLVSLRVYAIVRTRPVPTYLQLMFLSVSAIVGARPVPNYINCSKICSIYVVIANVMFHFYASFLGGEGAMTTLVVSDGTTKFCIYRMENSCKISQLLQFTF